MDNRTHYETQVVDLEYAQDRLAAAARSIRTCLQREEWQPSCDLDTYKAMLSQVNTTLEMVEDQLCALRPMKLSVGINKMMARLQK